MKNSEQIRARMELTRTRLASIERGIVDQRQRHFRKRRPEVCLFLRSEKRVGLAILDALEWVLDE